ncbi:MAG: OmpA family protein [Akkermansiaceae bacterium]
MKKCSPTEPIEPADSGAQTDKPSDLIIPDGPDPDSLDTGHSGTAEELVGQISKVMLEANETGNISPLLDILGQRNLSPQQTKHLHNLAAASRLKLDEQKPFSRSRDTNNLWFLNLTDKSKIKLNVKQDAQGNWLVDGITLPKKTNASTPVTPDTPGRHPEFPGLNNVQGAGADTVTDFLHAILKFDPATARKHIDTSNISYAKLAGLCIIFEEGKYKLAPKKPLRNMFSRDTSAGWIARVTSASGGETAMFAINTKRKDATTPWKITEINLDSLLTDYAKRMADGDIHYAPLIKDPKGGDSLAIYFDLDSDTLSARTQRQLSIVANLLKIDPNKKLSISGHTDSLGSEDYNLALSNKRANQVKQHLSSLGVQASQISITGHGKKLPRLPNVSEDGTDNPSGRRANRRAEILLDF